MARPYWSGTIQISLVQFAVKFFVATEAKSQIRFHQVSRSTGERVRHQKVLESTMENGDEEMSEQAATVGKDDIVKGYEYTKGKYVLIEPSEIANLRVPSKHNIAVEQFVDESEIDPAFFEKPYFVAPDGDAQAEAFAVVREAMQKAGKVALGKIAFGGREHIVALMASKDDEGRGLMAYTMRYSEELRDAKEYFSDIPKVAVDEDQLELAEQLIKKKTAKFDPKKYKDGYEGALKELVDAKIHNEPIPVEEPQPKRAKVINLMDALRSSLSGKATDEGENTPPPGKKSSKKEPAKKRSNVAEMPKREQATETHRKKASASAKPAKTARRKSA
ncbi:non-homologous end joining protein Ku [Terriglobus sp. ADX1]|uniref:non-homologous end joining protein Ku n=1 Tax=Terriglobus sp. ADX1 TaxID=2794063 RepID=UPI002FE60DF7